MLSLRRFIPVLVVLSFVPGLRAGLASAATAITPLPVGAKVPAVVVRSVEGADLSLPAVLARKPALLIFYRGSWCPYCNRHLAALAEIEPQLLALGCQIIALSPDDTAGLREMAVKNHLNYRLLSDRAMQAASAFGVAFRVDAETRKTYTGYGIALPPVPGEPDARWLPVPAVYVIDRDGTVKFVHADPDYKVRLSGEAVLAAVQSAL